MIRLGLRLTVAGGREAIARLAMIAIAVAIGIGLLLTTLASINAVNSQNARYAWLETAYTGSNAPAAVGAVGSDPLLWRLSATYFHGTIIGRVDLAATGPQSPIPPGIKQLPGPGQIYASPALARLLRTTPKAELGDRFPGTVVGTMGPAALPAPDSLVLIIGYSAAELSPQHGVKKVARISTTVPSSCSGDCALGVGFDARGITLILSVVAAALLFPVLIFIGSATRLSAARREQRFAAMRLVGATPRQISVVSTVESTVATSAGVGAGFGLFFALRPLLASIPFTGAPFFTTDLSLSLVDVLIAAVGVPIAAAVAARMALRRVTISPLGVSRRATPRPPSAWRVVPLLAGVGELAYLAYASNIGASKNSNAQAAAYLSGILVVMAGLVIAGPWVTMLGSRYLARRATRPASLIAARRLADDPRAGFRAISGLVLAVFVGTAALGIITTIVAYNGGSAGDSETSRGTVIEEFGPEARSGAPLTPGQTDAVTSVPGVTGLATIHYHAMAGPVLMPAPDEFLVTCAELARVPALGRCRAGADTVSIQPDFGGAVIDTTSMADRTWPRTGWTPAEVAALPASMVVVATSGTAPTVERVRTVLEHYSATAAGTPKASMLFAPQTIAERQASGLQTINDYKQLANVVILTSLPIAGCSLAVAVAGGLAERRRAFSLLRLTGAPLWMLRRVVTLEAAAPLVLTAVVSAGAGLLCAQLFLRAQLKETMQPPSAQYYLVVAAGVVASLGVIASTLPLLRRVTGPEAARND
jgi:hypothetical protein